MHQFIVASLTLLASVALSLPPAVARAESNQSLPGTSGTESHAPTVGLSPKVRVTPIEEPIPSIPIGAILPFLTRPYVLERKQIEDAPYVVAFADEHIIAGVGDGAYVRTIDGPVGQSYDIVRPGNAYIDPDSGATLGYEALFVGEASLERAGDPARVEINKMELEIGVGDRVLSSSKQKAQTSFQPHPAPQGTQGRIISVLGGVTQIGRYNVVVINMGSVSGVRPGHVFEVFNGGERVQDLSKNDELRKDWRTQRFWSRDTWYSDSWLDGWMPSSAPDEPDLPLRAKMRIGPDSVILPYERAGTLMVFRTFERLSFALVMSAKRPMFVLDAVRPPPA